MKKITNNFLIRQIALSKKIMIIKNDYHNYPFIEKHFDINNIDREFPECFGIYNFVNPPRWRVEKLSTVNGDKGLDFLVCFCNEDFSVRMSNIGRNEKGKEVETISEDILENLCNLIEVKKRFNRYVRSSPNEEERKILVKTYPEIGKTFDITHDFINYFWIIDLTSDIQMKLIYGKLR